MKKLLVLLLVVCSYARAGNNYNILDNTSITVSGGTIAGITSFGIRSSGTGAFDMQLKNTENLTANRALTITLGDAARTLTLNASPTFSNALTFAGTDSTTMTFPTTSATIARTDASNTFTGHQTIEGVTSTGATGTGNFVFSAAPVLTGNTTIGTVNKWTLTAPATGVTLTAGTDGATVTFQGTDTYVGRATTDTFTNKTFDTAGVGNVFKINGTQITAVTGTGSAVLATSPILVSPTLGAATATTLNGNTFTTGTYTLTGTAAKTLTFNNSLTLAGTDSTTMTFPSTSATIARTDSGNTFTGAQTINAGATAQALNVNSTAAAGTYMTVQNSGTSIALIGDSSNVDGGTVGNLALRSQGTYVSLGVAGTSYAKVNANGIVTTGLATTYLNNTSANYTVAASDYTITNNVAGTVTLTLPAAASFTGRVLVIRTVTANAVNSASSNVVPLAGGVAGTAILAATAGKFAYLQSDGSNWQTVMAN